MACLETGPMDAIDISQSVGIMEKEVYGHLEHIARSLHGHTRKLGIYPARCLTCDFSFEKRTRFTRPGRCPRCRGNRIKRPAYEILESSHSR